MPLLVSLVCGMLMMGSSGLSNSSILKHILSLDTDP
jgi:hypothetical protein